MKINTSKVYTTVKDMILHSICSIESSSRKLLDGCLKNETAPLAKWSLEIIEENSRLSETKRLPSCQDTGIAVVFLEVGQGVTLEGEYIESAVNRAVRDAYSTLRKSVADPLTRKNTGDNTPAVIHTRIVEGDRLAISFMAKGFGSENQSRVFMLNPSVGTEGIIQCILSAVRDAGSMPCPPIMLGVGIGGTLEKCTLLAKSALMRETGRPNSNPQIAEMEREVLSRINSLNIGVQGFGGKNTCFAVHIETYPTHIAGLPVAINFQCHAVRHMREEL